MTATSQTETSVRSFLKRNFPFVVHIHNFYTNIKFRGQSPDEVFNSIYERNAWGNAESLSGEGSEVESARVLIEQLPGLFARHGITSVLDLPCGDYNWMQHVDYGDVRYVGADIVKDMVESNQQKHGSDRVSFKCLDLTTDPLDTVDLVLIRDCLVHLSYDYIARAFDNIKKSGIKYALITSYPKSDTNYDIVTGGWRKLNFQKAPFNMPEPLDSIHENCQEGRYFADKVMALWDTSELRIDTDRS